MITFEEFEADKISIEIDDETGNITLGFDRAIPEDMEDMLQLMLIHVMHADSRVTFTVRPQEDNDD